MYVADRLDANKTAMILLEYGHEGPYGIGSNCVAELCNAPDSKYKESKRIIGIDDRSVYLKDGRCDQSILYDGDTLFCVLKKLDLANIKVYISNNYIKPIESSFTENNQKYLSAPGIVSRFLRHIYASKTAISSKLNGMTTKADNAVYELILDLRYLWSFVVDIRILITILHGDPAVDEYVCVVGSKHWETITNELSNPVASDIDITRVTHETHTKCSCIKYQSLSAIA